MAFSWSWVIDSPGGLAVRLAVGVVIFTVLAAVDLRRNGAGAQRWREYLFLVGGTACAIVYGVVNDQVTASVAWEYFYYGKGLEGVLGAHTPPDSLALHWEAAKVGLKSSWSAGLLIGVALLLANNPRGTLPRLSYWRLMGHVPGVLAIAAGVSVMLALAGYMGWLTWVSSDFRALVRDDLFRPYRFMAVFGRTWGRTSAERWGRCGRDANLSAAASDGAGVRAAISTGAGRRGRR